MKISRFAWAMVIIWLMLFLPIMAYGEKQKGAIKLTAKFTSIKGQVVIQRLGKDMWEPASLESILKAGDSVMTWKEASAIIKTANNNQIEIDSQSQLVINQLEDSKGKRNSAFHLPGGRIWVMVREAFSLKDKFSMTTPAATLIVRGTEFFVEVAKEGTTSIKVFKGMLIVMGAGESIFLSTGKETLVEPEKTPHPPTKIKEKPLRPSQRDNY